MLTLSNILNHPIKIKHLASWRPFIIRGWVILFRGRGTHCGPRGRGVPVCNMHQGEGELRGGGIVMSHPFQEGVGGPWWVTQKRVGPCWVIQKGRVPREAPPILIEGRGGGQIMLMWPFKTQYLLRRFWYQKDVCEVPAILLKALCRLTSVLRTLAADRGSGHNAVK